MMQEMYYYQIGNTPIREINTINNNRILIKTEGSNFLGSIKARSGYYMIKNLPETAKGKTIIESTSGNLGLALGFFCKEINLNFIALIDKTISKIKYDKLKNAGINTLMVEAEQGLDYRCSRIRLAQWLHESGKYYWVNQYDNPFNVKCHEETTAKEIWEQTEGKVTHVIAAMGSCGTICGIGNFFHKNNMNVKIIGVEPYGSTIFGDISTEYINAGAGLVGKSGNIQKNNNCVDDHYIVHDSDAIKCLNDLYNNYDINAGITSGMAYYVAQKISKEISDSYIVVISADCREAYNEYI